MKLAAPSLVLPGTVAENARFLAGRVEEAGLCCFETAGCLAYTEADLPRDLAALPLRWHVHLPVDLPWGEGGEAAAAAALAVFGRVAYLSPRLAVLHPPTDCPADAAREALAAFGRRWRREAAPPLLLENIPGCQLTELGAAFLEGEGLGVCLDVGHLLGYAQAELLASGLPERARLVHWSAPGPHPGKDRHLPLPALTGGQGAVARALLRRISPGAAHLVEVFDWPGVEASRRWLVAARAQAHPAARPA
ncbi:cobamide remodeling phosphodiesterase CbiR [Desulfovibrio sp.]|uniref:cobamide remodeling phosphodiesterase CbiR n=1 Tax=Desulfovibrio sp. TaxID=885 RepID=UPI0023D6F803|nr:cobamide remodeling phosphodiesterase CbiR [Desulfovibrio sp.]MDE7240477.1 sugar phosphate isomerase/epimerase [Desulfovibrio sp.]